MKIQIERMEDRWVLGIMIFRGWMTIDIPYWTIRIMTNREYNSFWRAFR